MWLVLSVVSRKDQNEGALQCFQIIHVRVLQLVQFVHFPARITGLKIRCATLIYRNSLHEHHGTCVCVAEAPMN